MVEDFLWLILEMLEAMIVNIDLQKMRINQVQYI